MPMSSGIAIIGAGIFAKEAHLPALVALGSAVPPLRAVYSRSERGAQDLASTAASTLRLNSPPALYHDDKSNGLDALLSRTDIIAVIIALPITIQPEVVLKALAAGKHVLSEKPVAKDVETGLELIRKYNKEYRNKGLIWRVAENYEAEPAFHTASRAIEAGKIGRVLFFKAVANNHMDKSSKWYNTPWRKVPDYQGGFLLDGGVHDVAALRVILPRALTHVSAFASSNKKHLPPQDTIHAIACSDSYFRGIIQLTFAAPSPTQPAEDDCVITGTDGWLSVNHVDSVFRISIRSVIREEGKPDEEMEEIIEVRKQGVETELSDFFGAIEKRANGLGLGNPLEALRDVAFIQAALNSEGNLVKLTDLVPASLD